MAVNKDLPSVSKTLRESFGRLMNSTVCSSTAKIPDDELMNMLCQTYGLPSDAEEMDVRRSLLIS